MLGHYHYHTRKPTSIYNINIHKLVLHGGRSIGPTPDHIKATSQTKIGHESGERSPYQEDWIGGYEAA